MTETCHLVAVPLASTLLRSDVEVEPVGVQCVNLVGGEQTTTVACGEGCEDFSCAHVLSGDAVALKPEVENVANHGDWRVVHAVDSCRAPRFKPRIVGDIVAEQTFVFGGHISGITEHGYIAKEGRGQTIGAVVGCTAAVGAVKVNENATVEGHDNAVRIGDHADDVGRTRVATRCTVVGLEIRASGVHLLNDG